MNETVSYESRDSVAVITIEREAKMNALNEDVVLGLRKAWQTFADSDDRVALLRARGERAFSVGADVKDPPREMWQAVPSVGVAVNKPIIACVRGWCIGGAYVIVQMCDLVVAASDTRFRYPEARLGFSGGLIASAVARIPHKIAMEFMLLGQDFSAQRAYEVGMVNRVVEPGEEFSAAWEYAEILKDSAPLVVAALKRFALETLNQSPSEAGAISRDTLLGIRASDDGEEGRQAFREKRKPRFKGR